MNLRAAWPVLIGVLLGCTHEHIVLDIDEGGEDAEYVSGETGSRICVAATAGEACRPNGGACAVAADCCSLRCTNGECLAAGSCMAPGGSCTARSDCCSGRCEPGTNGALVCLDYCAPQGSSCDAARDCCSLACDDDHVCGGRACLSIQASCMDETDCCSGVCGNGVCPTPAAETCLGSGEACGSPVALDCCSGTCAKGTCAAGTGPCLPESSPCTADADCCRGTCLEQDERFVCVASCLADGVACGSAGDCCNGLCAGNPSICGALASECSIVGATCDSSDDCCTGDCVGGFCAETCTPPANGN